MFVLEIGQEPPEYIVHTDESAVNILTTYHQNGWAYKGVLSGDTSGSADASEYPRERPE
jgi:hypothetical protein